MQPTMCSNAEDAYRNIWNECVCENFDDSTFANFPDVFPSTSYFPSEFPSCSDSSIDSQNTLFDPAIANDDVTTWLQSSFLDEFNFHPADYMFNSELPAMSTQLFPSQKVAPQEYPSPTISAAELARSLSISGPNGAEATSSILSTSTSLFSSPASSNTPLLASRQTADLPSVPAFSEEDSDSVTDNGDEGDASSDDDYTPSFRLCHRRSSSSGSFASRKAAMASVLRSSRSAPSHSPAGRPARSTRKRVSAQVISQRCKPRAKQVGASVSPAQSLFGSSR